MIVGSLVSGAGFVLLGQARDFWQFLLFRRLLVVRARYNRGLKDPSARLFDHLKALPWVLLTTCRSVRVEPHGQARGTFHYALR